MATKGELKLIGTFGSPFVNRVQLVLNLKSIDYEFVEENLACKSELLLTSNPVYKKVPVLIHANESPIPESLIIIEYLDEIFPYKHQILPSNPSDRSANRFWGYYIDNTFMPLYEELRRTPGEDEKAAIKKLIIEGSQLLEGAFVKLSDGKAYFGGDSLCYIDVVLGSFIAWTKLIEKINDFKVFDDDRTPGLAGWAKSMCSNEAIKSVMPGNEELMKLYMILQIYKPPRVA